MNPSDYEEYIYVLEAGVKVLEARVDSLSNVLGEIAPLIDNLNNRLMALENRGAILPPTKEEVHARMEIDGDGYQECETRILREKYAGGRRDSGSTSDD